MAKLESKTYVIGKAKIRDFSTYVPVSFTDFEDKEHLCELFEKKLDNFSLEVAEMLRILESTKQESMSELVRYIAEQEAEKKQLLEKIEALENTINNSTSSTDSFSQQNTEHESENLISSNNTDEKDEPSEFIQEQTSDLPEDEPFDKTDEQQAPSFEEPEIQNELSSDNDTVINESMPEHESVSDKDEQDISSLENNSISDELPDNIDEPDIPAVSVAVNEPEAEQPNIDEISAEQEFEQDNFSNLNPFSQEDEDEDKDKIDFNQLAKDTQFPRQKATRQRMEENMSDDALELQKAMERINIMRSRLHPVNDEHGFLPTEKSAKIDEILTKELDELEESHNLDLDATVSSDMEDAALVEAINIAERLDKENYPDLYDVDKDSLIYYIQAQVSARNLRRKRTLGGDEIRQHRRPVNTLDHYGREMVRNRLETSPMPDLPQRAEPKLDTQTVPQETAAKEDESAKALDLPATTASAPKASETEPADDLNKALNSLSGETEEKKIEVPSTPDILTSERKSESKSNPISSLFNEESQASPQENTPDIDEPSLEEGAGEEEIDAPDEPSDNKLIPVEVPVEFLTKLEKIKSRLFKYRVYMTLAEIKDFENNDNAMRMQELVEEARARHWKN